MLLEKLQKLGMAATYDSCGGTSKRKNSSIPGEYSSFIHDCAGTAENCRLMKVLQDNDCMHDCKYCGNTACKEKVLVEPKNLAGAFLHLAKRGYVEGLFLSSSVHGNSSRSTEKMIETVQSLRARGYGGYVHMKVLPETPRHQIKEMCGIANRLSLNIESATKSGFEEMTSTKKYKQDIMKRIRWLDFEKRRGRLKSFTTQIILGASWEDDRAVLNRMDSLYKETSLHRTYFSAFEHVPGTPLEKVNNENPMREHRLYEADWLFRVYGFSKKEIESGLVNRENFSLQKNVKLQMALANSELFPLDINTCSEKELLMIPGFGPKTVEKIINEREKKKFRGLEDLKGFANFSKAKNFVALEGKQTSLFSF